MTRNSNPRRTETILHIVLKFQFDRASFQRESERKCQS